VNLYIQAQNNCSRFIAWYCSYIYGLGSSMVSCRRI